MKDESTLRVASRLEASGIVVVASTTYPSTMEKMWSKATMVFARDWVTSTANSRDVPRFGALLRR